MGHRGSIRFQTTGHIRVICAGAIMQKPACKTKPDCPVTECKKEPFTQNGITATVGRLVEQFAATWHENFRHKLQCARTVLVPDVCAALSSRRVVFRLFRKVVIYWCISKLIVTNRKPPSLPPSLCALWPRVATAATHQCSGCSIRFRRTGRY